jgi:hypothetical protein
MNLFLENCGLGMDPNPDCEARTKAEPFLGMREKGRTSAMKKRLLISVICLVLVFPATAGTLPDTPENRQAAAQTYIQYAAFEELVQNVIAAFALKMPESQRKDFIDKMKWNVRVDTIEKTAVDSLVRHFSVEELTALTEFAGSPQGRGVMKKFGAYMSDLMQDVQHEMVRSYRLYKEEKSREKR